MRSNLAIGISKIHYRSTSNIYQHNNIFEYIKYATTFLIDDANESEIWISSFKQVWIYITFTFMYLADTFIQNNLQQENKSYLGFTLFWWSL